MIALFVWFLEERRSDGNPCACGGGGADAVGLWARRTSIMWRTVKTWGTVCVRRRVV